MRKLGAINAEMVVRFDRGESNAEVAKAMGLGIDAVAQRKYRLRKKGYGPWRHGRVTNERQRAIDMLSNLNCVSAVANATGLSKSCVSEIAGALRKKGIVVPTLSQKRQARVAHLTLSGASDATIAADIGVHPSSVRNIRTRARKAGINIPNRSVERGKKNRAEVERRIDAGESVADIAAALSIATSTVYAHVYGLGRTMLPKKKGANDGKETNTCGQTQAGRARCSQDGARVSAPSPA